MKSALFGILLLVGLYRDGFCGQADAFEGDARLNAVKTIRVLGEPLGTAFDRLSHETGVRFTGDPSVADDKLILYAYRRPLSVTLRTVARYFGFVWTRRDSPEGLAYHLSMPESTAAKEQFERKAELRETAATIAREVAFANSLAPLNLEQLNQKRAEISSALSAEKVPARRQQLVSELNIHANIVSNPRFRAAVPLLAVLSTDEIEGNLSASREYVWPAQPGKAALPEPIAKAILESANAEANNGNPQNPFHIARIKLGPAGDRGPGIAITVEAAYNSGGNRGHSGTKFSLPVALMSGQQLDVPTPNVPADESLHLPVTFSVRSEPNVSLAAEASLPAPALAPVIDALQMARATDLIAGAFYSTMPSDIEVREAPLYEALDTIGRQYGQRWRKEDGFVLLRPIRYARLRAEEPAASKLLQWIKTALDTGLDLDTLAAISALPDPVYQTTLRTLSAALPLLQFTRLEIGRDACAFWRKLSASQRKSALEQGLPYSSLDEELKKSSDAVAKNGLARGALPMSDEQRGSAVLRVDMRETRVWAYRGQGGAAVVGGPTREAALATLRTSFPDLNPDLVVEALQVRARFLFGPPQRPQFTEVFNLPLRPLRNR